ncbi:hypothetical protein AQUCO_03500272v1 [Aquilegia coerulea]|uniref:Uncharacterized protein n=1 Tax=Aquilegia coerulea TaxID=218851 RepID=A0A2G5CWZ5_AQUCA|nr:hypothetical protein AQUCO_03500272v1 [Aquilegia coerulea]
MIFKTMLNFFKQTRLLELSKLVRLNKNKKSSCGPQVLLYKMFFTLTSSTKKYCYTTLDLAVITSQDGFVVQLC